MSNSGMIFRLKDGRRGVAFHDQQEIEGRLLINLVEENLKPIISEATGKQAIVFRTAAELDLEGFID